MNSALLQFFYTVKPLIPRSLQILLRRKLIRQIRAASSTVWPIFPGSGDPSEGWTGWPDGARFAIVLTHDIETAVGVDRVCEVMRREKELGFCSSFNFVPERYDVRESIRREIVGNGFEVGVHGLKHDGKLFFSRRVFRKRGAAINRYLAEWGAVGFGAPAMHHNFDWIPDLNIEYDSSTCDTDPFEPQPDGAGTIFPYVMPESLVADGEGIVELPYTLPQDFTLFVLMQEEDTSIWEKKLCWLAETGGMVLMKTHPDYMNLYNSKLRIDEYPGELYFRFLEYIKSTYHGQYWHVLPRDMARFWISHHSGATFHRSR